MIFKIKKINPPYTQIHDNIIDHLDLSGPTGVAIKHDRRLRRNPEQLDRVIEFVSNINT